MTLTSIEEVRPSAMASVNGFGDDLLKVSVGISAIKNGFGAEEVGSKWKVYL
jgi:hypothetical protein